VVSGGVAIVWGLVCDQQHRTVGRAFEKSWGTSPAGAKNAPAELYPLVPIDAQMRVAGGDRRQVEGAVVIARDEQEWVGELLEEFADPGYLRGPRWRRRKFIDEVAAQNDCVVVLGIGE
jgi:hypothetical protein